MAEEWGPDTSRPNKSRQQHAERMTPPGLYWVRAPTAPTAPHLLHRLTHTRAYLNWLASDRWIRWHCGESHRNVRLQPRAPGHSSTPGHSSRSPMAGTLTPQRPD